MYAAAEESLKWVCRAWWAYDVAGGAGIEGELVDIGGLPLCSAGVALDEGTGTSDGSTCAFQTFQSAFQSSCLRFWCCSVSEDTQGSGHTAVHRPPESTNGERFNS